MSNTQDANEPLAPCGGSAAKGEDYDTPEYQAFLAECAKHCRCTHDICEAVMAGAPCDERIEDDRDDYRYEDDEGYE